MPQSNFVKVQMYTWTVVSSLFFSSIYFFSFFWKICVCSAQGDTPLDPRFSFPLLCFLFFPSYLFCILSILVRSLIFSSVAFSREILFMFIAGSTYAESNASTGRHVNFTFTVTFTLGGCARYTSPKHTTVGNVQISNDNWFSPWKVK